MGTQGTGRLTPVVVLIAKARRRFEDVAGNRPVIRTIGDPELGS